MKTAVSSHSFYLMIESKRLNQFELVGIVKEIGFDGIEFTDLRPHDGSDAQEYAMRLGEECRRLALPVANYTVSADFMRDGGGHAEEEIERVKGQVDIAALLGATGMRHDVLYGFASGSDRHKGFEGALTKLAAACKEVTEYAKTKGVRTMVENHGYIVQESLRVERLINAVGDENFGWLYDMGNFVVVDEDFATAAGRAAQYAFHVHAKDFHIKSGMWPDPGEGYYKTRGGVFFRSAIFGHGNVPALQCLAALKAAEYDGYISIEFEGMEDPMLAVRIGMENLKHYISLVENSERTLG